MKKIWKDNKTKIMKNFLIIEKKDFWKKYKINNFEEIQKDYIQVRNLIRLETVIELKKGLRKDLEFLVTLGKIMLKMLKKVITIGSLLKNCTMEIFV